MPPRARAIEAIPSYPMITAEPPPRDVKEIGWLENISNLASCAFGNEESCASVNRYNEAYHLTPENEELAEIFSTPVDQNALNLVWNPWIGGDDDLPDLPLYLPRRVETIPPPSTYWSPSPIYQTFASPQSTWSSAPEMLALTS